MQKKYCNICGKEFNEWDYQENYSLHTKIGFGSKHDGETLALDICTECMDKLIDSCKISPVYEIEEAPDNEGVFKRVK